MRKRGQRAALAALLGLWGATAMSAAESTVDLTLNGLQITLDAQTGGILKLACAGPGTLLETDQAGAGLLDLACPLPTFEPLRLATRYAARAEITRSAEGVTVVWPQLGASRDLPLSGPVAATVRITAAPDGRSVLLSCEVRNGTDRPLRQVLFPDLNGLLPSAGVDRTILKTGGFGSAPFRELKLSESDEFYAQTNAWREYKSGGMFSEMWMRWFDLGGLQGGLSLFPRLWGWEPRSSLLVHLSPRTQKLRLMCAHEVTIEPGQTWSSEVWVLTAHRGGWAKGIEPYREWARQHVKRVVPVPDHVRRGLGFRSAWMCQNQPTDPAGDAVWRFRDLPALARDAKEHGLDEMVLWSTHPGFSLPTPTPFPHLGTEEELAQAVAECRRLGVNVAPFVSVLQANKATGPRYGLKVPDTGGWTYHTELVPRFNPPYAGNYACAQVDTANAQWQADVLAFAKHLVDLGIPSLSWDQFWATPTEPNIQTLAAQIRAYSRSRDPQSTFSGEELWNIEVDCDTLDYTWNWGGYRDCQAYTNVFPVPRRNLNINRSVGEVKRGFLDGFYLNVWPAKPGGVNGSDWIAANADLSRALKQCDRLRTRFTDALADGIFIGDCILSEECPGVHATARVLPDRVLLLVTNEGAGADVTLKVDLSPWLPAPAGGYTACAYDADGNPTGSVPFGSGPQPFLASAMGTLETRAVEFIKAP